MNGFRNRRRAAAVLATAATLALAGAGTAGAATSNPLSGLFGSPPATGQTTPTVGLPGMGLFKAAFAIFGAVHTALPAIAAPIIAQGVTDQTITPAEATQLTTLLAGQHMAPTMGAGGPPTKPSAGEIAILHKIFAAVLGQLATIAAPVLAKEVTAGDITQAEADLITKIITRLSGALSSATPTTTAPAALTGSAMSGNLLSTLASTLTTQVHKTTKHHTKHKKAKKAKAARH